MNNRLRVLWIFTGSFVSVCAFIGAFIGILSYFGLNPFKGYGILGIILVIETSLIFAAIITYFKTKAGIEEEITSIYPETKGRSKIANNLRDEIQRYMEKKNYNDVIGFGSSVSRVLWLNGEYEIRVQIGKMVEEAATRLDRIDIKAITLIDDIGWTLVPLKRFDEAEENIKHGIEIASQRQDYYLVAKGKRHMGGIEIERRHYDKAIDFLNEAMKTTEQISDVRKKKEMIGGIMYGLAEAHYFKSDIEKAKDYCEKAKGIFESIDDKDRLAKYFAQIGKIFEAEGKTSESRDFYLKGLEFSKRIKRIDEIIRNYLGLARIYAKKGAKNKARENLYRAKSLLKHTPIFFFGDTNLEIKQVEKTIKRR